VRLTGDAVNIASHSDSHWKSRDDADHDMSRSSPACRCGSGRPHSWRT
jgi:hypothetical protein